MVKIDKSKRPFLGLLLLPILLVMGVINNPKASSTAEELPRISSTQAQIRTNLSIVAEAPPVQPIVISSQGLKISAINLNIPLSKTTLDKNRALMVPTNPNVAAWYRNGPKPGEAGSALITGHLDSSAGPGVFFNLKNLKPNELIEVKRDDGKIAVFKIDKLESYAQDHTFPWHLVYSTSGAASLRLITCDGVYNPKTQRYSRNLVVYASLVSLT